MIAMTFGFAVTATLEIDDELLVLIQSRYGKEARQRIVEWRKLMQSAKDMPEEEKLQRVNRFFNRMQFVDDIFHWGKEDYWATPFEFLATNAGDCEDFSIAKYFTLVEMGVSEEKLRITYVKALELNQAHMVLTYFPTIKSIPRVLDNLIDEIKPATQRKDLAPVYSFNGTGLWLAKSRGSGKHLGGSGRLSLWQDLKERMYNKKFKASFSGFEYQ
ncbi:MAG: transglutaminase-like cysteine peptidase [Gammaproteobacteria bacterium]